MECFVQQIGKDVAGYVWSNWKVATDVNGADHHKRSEMEKESK